MQKSSPKNAVVRAFQILDEHATLGTVKTACSQLFRGSELCGNAILEPFTQGECNAIADAIFQYVVDPTEVVHCNIEFVHSRDLLGESIGCQEFAARFSAEFLYQRFSAPYKVLSREDGIDALKVFLAAILFRYRYCVFSDAEVFHISAFIEYVEAVRAVFSDGLLESESRTQAALWNTLAALWSMEDL